MASRHLTLSSSHLIPISTMQSLSAFFPPFLTLLFIFIVSRIWKKTIANNNSISKLPPGPWRLPIIGNLHQLSGHLLHHRLRDLAKKYGPLMHLQLGEISTVIITSPELAKEVMRTNDILFAQRPFNLAANILFYNNRDVAFAPYGDYWRRLRKICTTELLSTKSVRLFQSIREEEVSYLINSISSSAGMQVNLSRMSSALVNCITLRAAFGKSKKQQDIFVPLVRKIVLLLGGFTVSDLFPSIKLLQVISGRKHKIEMIHQEMDVILESIISEHKARKLGTDKTGTDTQADDFVDVLLNHQGENLEVPLTMDDIKAVIQDIFVAGSDTASIVIEWAMSEMMKHPGVMKKAQTEVRQAFNDKNMIDESSIHVLKYLNLIIKETLRLHPSGPLLLPREAREKAEIEGYEIPAKTQVIINAWAIGRDPPYWIEPERFYPERFLDSSISYHGTHFEYIPFGSGRRVCPGIAYGMTIVELTLANLLYHFDWKLPNGMVQENLDMDEAPGIAVRRKNSLCLIPIPYHSTPAE